MTPTPGKRDSEPARRWLDKDILTVEDQSASAPVHLLSRGFISAALRRGVWFCCIAAVVGLAAGSGLYLRSAHVYQASTTLLLTVGPEPQPGVAILEDQAIAQSHSVAGLALRTLGLRQSTDSFLGSYTVTVLTDRILSIATNASSSSQAEERANAVATEFLKFRASQLLAEQQLEVAALNQQLAQERQGVAAISKQITSVLAQPRSAARQAELSNLRDQEHRASSDLAALEQTAATSKASIKVTTAQMIGGSKVLDPASPVPQKSRKSRLLEYVGGALIASLMLAMVVLIVQALVSERLRRRDDVARALDAPVRSVPAARAGRRLLPGRGSRDPGDPQQRIVEYLRDAVPASFPGTAALAIVPVGDPRVAARSIVALAESCALAGKQVVVADLSAGAQAAALLGVKDPGVRIVDVDGARLVAVVPDPAEFAPIGPFSPPSLRTQSATARGLAAACTSADLLLTLIPLDPAVGGDHLCTWAADAVVMLTAGESSWTRIHAVGEMIRLAGTRLAFAVLSGADKADESLGVTRARPSGRQPVPAPAVEAEMERALSGVPRRAVPEEAAIPAAQMEPLERAHRRLRRGD